MKKILFCLLVIAFTFSLSAEVYKSSVEIKAYKELEDATPPPQEQVTLTLLGPTEVQFADGFNIDIPEDKRDISYTAFYWILSGNIYNGVTLSFSFGPMSIGIPSDSPSVTIDDKSTVIPYTVALSHIQTQVTKDNTTRTIGTSKINKADANTAFDTGLKYYYIYSVYINYADSITGTSSGTVSTSTVSNLSLVYNLNTNSYAWYDNYSKSKYNSAITTCNDWVRKGKADITLKIDEDGKWTAVDTSVLINGGVYKAYVKVEVSVN